MEETFYEMLERTRAVDRLLFWLAIVLPLLVALSAAVLRNRPVVEKQRHRWVLALLAGPGLLVLWKVYNAVTDHFGPESVKGLLANVGVFAAAALVVTALRLLLKAMLTTSPTAFRTASSPAGTLPPTEFRPYKAGGLATKPQFDAKDEHGDSSLQGAPGSPSVEGAVAEAPLARRNDSGE